MTISAVSSLSAQLILLGDVHKRPLLEAILAAFEHEPTLQPTHWGAAEGLRDPYDHLAVVAAVEEAPEEGIVPHLIRTHRPCRYNAHWYGGEGDLTASVHVETRGRLDPEEVALFFGGLSHIAGKLPVDWGHIDVKFEGQDGKTNMLPGSSSDHLGLYSRIGPTALFPRAFFGPRLLAIAEGGAAAIEATGLPCKNLPNDVLQVDLIPSPWTSEPSTLKRAQERAHEVLRPLGILARLQPGSSPLPGPSWHSPRPTTT